MGRRLLDRMIYTGSQLVRFGVQQALACLFPAVIFAGLAITRWVELPWLDRYDWLLLLVIVSFLIVAQLKLVKRRRGGEGTGTGLGANIRGDRFSS